MKTDFLTAASHRGWDDALHLLRVFDAIRG
jgi:hypothetical protein